MTSWGVEVRVNHGAQPEHQETRHSWVSGGLGAGVPTQTEEGAAHQNSPSSILIRSCSRT